MHNFLVYSCTMLHGRIETLQFQIKEENKMTNRLCLSWNWKKEFWQLSSVKESHFPNWWRSNILETKFLTTFNKTSPKFQDLLYNWWINWFKLSSATLSLPLYAKGFSYIYQEPQSSFSILVLQLYFTNFRWSCIFEPKMPTSTLRKASIVAPAGFFWFFFGALPLSFSDKFKYYRRFWSQLRFTTVPRFQWCWCPSYSGFFMAFTNLIVVWGG